MRGFMHEHGPRVGGNKLTRDEHIWMAIILVGLIATPVLMTLVIKYC